MPIYEYECAECGNKEEVLQKFSDQPLTTCNKCSGKLHKLISHSSFHLKGSGWYVTDYADKSKQTKSREKSPESKASDAKSTKTKTSDVKTTKNSEKKQKNINQPS
ncbi:MAG: FmdB family transcriptional regulator [Desulfobacteraceae bacterium 4572_123]|nr:MAG: FmdB family transcriptional regulator [Desulfobacteraceae bacterium 4572_123]